MRPSFLGLGITGIITTIAIITYILNFKKFNTNEHVTLLFLMSITIGIHSILHHYEEIYYGFNPLKNKNEQSIDTS